MVDERKEIHMKIKALLVIPNKEVQIVKIPASNKFLEAFIGNELYTKCLDKNNILIANKNASIDEFNRVLGNAILLGTFLIISIKNNRKVSMKKKDIRKFTNIFKLRKHQKKINMYKEDFLEDYYSKQRKMKRENAERNKENIFKLAA